MIVVVHALEYARKHPSSEGGIAANLVEWSIWCLIGVPFFFVISGYCIAANADSIRRRTSHSPSVFFMRRFRRIFPPFWAAFAFAAVVYFVANSIQPGYLADEPAGYALPGELSLTQWLGNLTLTEEWRYHLVGDAKRQLLGPAWSLAYEEQFYAVVGLLLLTARRWFFSGAAVVTLLVLVAKHTLPALGVPTNGFFFDGYWLAFATGILVYYAMNYLAAGRQWWAYVLLALGIPYALRGQFGVGVTTEMDLVQSVAFALLILALGRYDRQTVEAPSMRPLLWCGAMCYSLYLVHLPITTVISRFLYTQVGVTSAAGALLVTLPLCMLASLVVGRAFYHLVERRFLNAPVVAVSAQA
jgi:peptidoglycan/LPS O-acetylase OafA/YrhL